MKKITTVDKYISSYPKDVQIIMEKIRHIIKDVIPNIEEEISYGMPSYRLNGKYLMYFAAWKNHFGLYPNPSNNSIIKKELKDYKQSKGAIQFPYDRPFPYDLLKKILKYRVEEIKKEG